VNWLTIEPNLPNRARLRSRAFQTFAALAVKDQVKVEN